MLVLTFIDDTCSFKINVLERQYHFHIIQTFVIQLILSYFHLYTFTVLLYQTYSAAQVGHLHVSTIPSIPGDYCSYMYLQIFLSFVQTLTSMFNLTFRTFRRPFTTGETSDFPPFHILSSLCASSLQ